MQRLMMVVIMGLSAAGVSAQSRPAALEPQGVQAVGDPTASASVAAVRTLVRLDPTVSWRMEVAVEAGETVLRWTPSDAASELQPARSTQPPTVEARVVTDAAGDLNRVRIDDANRASVRVAAGATTADRQTALQPARYRPATKADLLQMLGARPWRALGRSATVVDAAIVWRAAASGEEAIWEVRLTAERAGAVKSYIVRADPTDGRLIEIVREGVR